MLTTVSPTLRARDPDAASSAAASTACCARAAPTCVGILNGIDVEEWNPADRSAPAGALRTAPRPRRASARARPRCCEEAGLPVRARRAAARRWSRASCRRRASTSLLDVLDGDPRELGRRSWWCSARASRARACFATLAARVPAIAVACSARLRQRARAPDRGRRRPLPHAVALRAVRAQPDVQPRATARCPIVRATGGLADTVQNYDAATGHGTGFVFEDLTPERALRHRRLGPRDLVPASSSRRADAPRAPWRSISRGPRSPPSTSSSTIEAYARRRGHPFAG